MMTRAHEDQLAWWDNHMPLFWVIVAAVIAVCMGYIAADLIAKKKP